MADIKNKIITISNKKTSMRMTQPEWDALNIICEKENIRRSALLDLIDNNKDKNLGLTCSVRLFVLIYLYHLFLEKQCPNYAKNKIKSANDAIFHAIKGIL